MKSFVACIIMLLLILGANAQKSTRVESTVKLSSLKQSTVKETPLSNPVSVTYNLDIKSEEDNKKGAITTTSTAQWKGIIYEVYQNNKSGKEFIIVPNTKDTGFHRKYISY